MAIRNLQSEIQNPKLVVGLIGGIGSGKSLVAQLLAERGGVVIQGDALGHEALKQPDIRERVVARFGPGVIDAQGEIVRRRLAERVFTNDEELRALERLVFPYIRRRAEELIAEARANPKARFVVLDAAVMLEAGWNTACDRIVYVHAPRDVRLARLAKRGWSETQVADRERAQLPLAEKARRADAAIDNGGDVAQTATQVDRILREWNL